MALPNISTSELKKRNEASQAAREAEKRGSASAGKQNK